MAAPAPGWRPRPSSARSRCRSDRCPATCWRNGPMRSSGSFPPPGASCASARPGGRGAPRLEIRDSGLAIGFGQRAGAVRRVGEIDRRSRAKVVGWSFAALVSAVLVAIFGVPAIVARLTPLVPARLEKRLGASVDQQVRLLLDPGTRPFEGGAAAPPG